MRRLPFLGNRGQYQWRGFPRWGRGLLEAAAEKLGPRLYPNQGISGIVSLYSMRHLLAAASSISSRRY
jgi:hypothetical protein